MHISFNIFTPHSSRDKRRLPLASVSEMVAVTDGDKPIKLREAGMSQTRPRTYQQLIRQSRNIEINQKKYNVREIGNMEMPSVAGFWESLLNREG